MEDEPIIELEGEEEIFDAEELITEEEQVEPHMVLSERASNVEEPKKKSTRKERKERKSVKERPKKNKEARKPKKAESAATEALRNELKLCILKHAEATQMSQAELKKELSKAARVKENDLPFELDKQRLLVSGSWTKECASGIKNGVGVFFDNLLKAEGHVAKEFAEDRNLETAIHGQLEKATFLLDPRLRIGILTAKDVVTGCVNKRVTGVSVSAPNTSPLLVRQIGVYARARPVVEEGKEAKTNATTSLV